MIELQDIRKMYGELEVLKGITLEIPKGEVVAIVGPSGAGKTTLLQIMGTLDRPTKGHVRLAGVEVEKLNDRKLSSFRNRHIGFVFQFHHLLPEFTALENVMMPAFIAGDPRSDCQRRATELLRYMNLSSRLEHRPSELSGGEQQRVAVARALMNKPDVLLADEPSGNLDSQHAEELHQLFFKLRDELGQTIVVVTHNPLLAEMADRTIRLIDGQVAFNPRNC